MCGCQLKCCEQRVCSLSDIRAVGSGRVDSEGSQRGVGSHNLRHRRVVSGQEGGEGGRVVVHVIIAKHNPVKLYIHIYKINTQSWQHGYM